MRREFIALLRRQIHLHSEGGETDRDQELSATGFAQLAAYISDKSSGRAIILGGDTNLYTDDDIRDTLDEADAQIWEGFKKMTGLVDVCDVITPCESSIDKFAFRSNKTISLEPISHVFERDKFVDDEGDPLSDHDPLAVNFRWPAKITTS